MSATSRTTALLALLAAIASHGSLGPRAAAQHDDADNHDLTLVDNRPSAQPPPDRRSVLLQGIMEKHKLPALAAAVVTSTSVEYLGASGLRAASRAERATSDDLWHLGSCTKSMTATLAAILVAQGKLSWETTLAQAFPDLATSMHEGFRGVTLQQLCTNRGGFPTGLDRDGLWGKLWRHKGTPTQARRFLLEGVTAHAPEYPPGAQCVYSNGGFAVAGHMCETVAGKPFEELMQELLFKPLGMTSAGFGAPGTPGLAIIPDQPRGHDKAGVPQEPTHDGRGADNPTAITPAGRVHCSLGDWARYIQFHLKGSRGEPQTIGGVKLGTEVFRLLHKPPDLKSDYAFGWIRVQRPWAGPENDRFTLTHTGSNTMWFCVTWVAPARDFAVLVCCNKGEGGDKATDEAAFALIQDYLKRAKRRDAPIDKPD